MKLTVAGDSAGEGLAKILADHMVVHSAPVWLVAVRRLRQNRILDRAVVECMRIEHERQNQGHDVAEDCGAIGHLRAMQRDWRAAADSFRAVLARDPNNAPARENLKMVLEEIAKEEAN